MDNGLYKLRHRCHNFIKAEFYHQKNKAYPHKETSLKLNNFSAKNPPNNKENLLFNTFSNILICLLIYSITLTTLNNQN